jgi:hypothetical protein
MEFSAQCGVQYSPKAEDVQQLVSNYNIGQPLYVYPTEENPNIYNSFITPEQQKYIEETKAAAEPGTAQIPAVPNQNSNVTEDKKVNDCLKNISDQDMPKAIVWIEEIMKKIQGSQ